MIRRDPAEAGLDDRTEPSAPERTRIVWWRVGLAAVAFTAVVAAFLAIPWYPVVLPDSLAYLDHAGDLAGGGLVEFGFRQVGYPLWLAAAGSIGHLVGIQPLQAVVLAQLLLFAGAIVVSVVVLRWWSAPVVGILCLPTMLGYGNFLLTEAIGAPLAVIAAAAVVAVARSPVTSRAALRWMVIAYAGAAILPVIRLHYGLMSVAIVVGVLWSRGSLDRSRRTIGGAVAVMTLVGVLVVGLTLENAAEHGVPNPSLGSERALYWVLYESIVPEYREVVATAAPQVYRDGRADTLLLDIDRSELPYTSQQERYRAAIDTLLDVTGERLLEQRVRSSLAVLAGGRLDDVRGVLIYTSGPGGGHENGSIHQYRSARPIDVNRIADEYNRGEPVEPIRLRDPDGIDPPAPYVGLAIALVIPLVALISGFLIVTKRGSGPALAAAITLFGYAAASFLFVFDNFRYLLPPYLFALTAVVGAVMIQWARSSSGGAAARAPSRTRST